MQAKTFLVEKSRTRIYQRIIESFQNAISQLGHRVLLIDISQFDNYQDYLAYIQDQSIDYCLITNPRGLISNYIEAADAYVFELASPQLIFIHHDNCFSEIHDLEKICRKLQAFLNVKHKSYHFCLEYYNFLDLKSLGIEAVYPILHASEFTSSPQVEQYCYDVSFVGHVLPGLADNLEDIPFSHRLRADFWNRLVQLDKRLEPSAIALAENFPIQNKTELDYLAAKYFYASLLHIHSQFFRGEVIRRIDAGRVDIIGGDPAYLHGADHNRQIEKGNVHYHPPMTDYSVTQKIYAQSKINLNITSLQFDQAVINRVIDVGAAGGFVLTDWKADLTKVTSVAQEISYRTIEELNYKIDYFLHPDHELERRELAATLQQDIQKNCTYTAIVNFILNKVEVELNTAETLKIDLGCGPWKAPGFIGVDIAPAPGVDVVADLSQRFPFADSSVDVVRAHDVIEHLADRIHTMNEIWRICKPGALVDIRVPSTDGRGAFQDPTHISFWNINSFRYYCVEFPNYLKLCHIYGFKGAFSIESLSEEASEDAIIHVNVKLRAIKTQPETAQEQLLKAFKLREINLLACPDWWQPEEALFQDLVDLLRAIITHPNWEKIALLIDARAADLEMANAVITGAMMYLMVEEEIELAEEPDVSLLHGLQSQQWQALLPQLAARIALESNSQVTDFKQNVAPISELPVINLANLKESLK